MTGIRRAFDSRTEPGRAITDYDLALARRTFGAESRSWPVPALLAEIDRLRAIEEAAQKERLVSEADTVSRPIDWTAEDERRAIFREGLLAVGEHPMTQSDPSPNVIDVVNRALLDHEPKIDHNYEEVECKCGWMEPDLRPRGYPYRGPKDGAADWPDHQRRAVRAALKEALT